MPDTLYDYFDELAFDVSPSGFVRGAAGQRATFTDIAGTPLNPVQNGTANAYAVSDDVGALTYQLPVAAAIRWVGSKKKRVVSLQAELAASGGAEALAALDQVAPAGAGGQRTVAAGALPDLSGAYEAVNPQNRSARKLGQAVYVVTDPQWSTGAKGDGATDDTVPIQACLDAVDAAGGGYVIFPRGGLRYRVSQLCWPKNSRILLGELITSTGLAVAYNYRNSELGNGSTAYARGRSNIVIHGGVIDMQAHVLLDTVAPHNAMTFLGCTNIEVRGTRIKNVNGYHGIEFHSARHCLVDNVRGEGYRVNAGNSATPREFIQLDSNGLTGDDGTRCEDITVRKLWVGTSTEMATTWPRCVGSHTVPTTGTTPTGAQHTGIVIDDVTGVGVQDMVRAYSWLDTTIRTLKPRSITGFCVLADCADGVNGRGLVVDGISGRDMAGVLQVNSSPAASGTWSQVQYAHIECYNVTGSGAAIETTCNRVIGHAVRLDTTAGHAIQSHGNNPNLTAIEVSNVGGVGVIVQGLDATGNGGTLDDIEVGVCGSYGVQIGGGTVAAPLSLADVEVGQVTVKTPGNAGFRLSVGAKSTRFRGAKVRGGLAVSGTAGSQTGGAVSFHQDATDAKFADCDFGRGDGTAYTITTWYALNGGTATSWPGCRVAAGGAIAPQGTATGQLGNASTRNDNLFAAAA